MGSRPMKKKKNLQRTIINNYWMRICDIQNKQGRGRGYYAKPKASSDNNYRDLDYSGYHKNWI